MRISSSHSHADRGADAYFSPPEAVWPLMGIEALPAVILEPSAGNGAIVRPLQAAGHKVIARDLHDYGAGYEQWDYLTAPALEGIGGIVTNPPYRLAQAFAEKAVREAPYVALLLRINWLESMARLPFFLRTPPARILVSSRRLPMMHREGWEGPVAPSNTCYAWFVWDERSGDSGQARLKWFDWQEYVEFPHV